MQVWLRFAHEGKIIYLHSSRVADASHTVNWYQTDKTYTGGVQEFKAAWAAVAAAVADNDLVKMFVSIPFFGCLETTC